MEKFKDWLGKNWQMVTIMFLIGVVAYLLGGSSRTVDQSVAVPTEQPTESVVMCDTPPFEFSSIETMEDGTTVFKYLLPDGFNSGVEFGDGQHSNFKSNTTGQTLEVVVDHKYPANGVYSVGLYTYDYQNMCDNGAHLLVEIFAPTIRQNP